MIRILGIMIIMLAGFSSVAHPPWGIVVDNQGNIYFADILHNGLGSVWKFTTEGNLELVLGDFHAHNVNLDDQGNLVVANGEDHQTMIRILGNGRYDTLVTTTDFTEFNGGNCTLSHDGAILFGIGNYLWKIDKAGHKTRLSDFRFGWNQTIYAAADGSFYAPDIGDGRGRIIRIDSKGNSAVLASNIMQLENRKYDRSSDVLLGMAQNSEGDIFISDTAGRRIVKIDDDGRQSTFYQPGGEWLPTGITFHKGAAYILEFNGNTADHGPRITKITRAGITTVVFDYHDFDL